MEAVYLSVKLKNESIDFNRSNDIFTVFSSIQIFTNNSYMLNVSVKERAYD
jgi:hypothetical protein